MSRLYDRVSTEMPDDERIGLTIAGKYRLERRLGAGSMGAVYQGTHLGIGKRVAIKMIHPSFATSPEAIARFRREARAAGDLPGGGLPLGPPLYMSPEQGQGGEVDLRTDVWSLCAVLYEALGGDPPFDRRSEVDVLVEILYSNVRPLRDVAPWVPLSVAKIVEHGLQRNRNVRLADAATLADSLTAAVPEITFAMSGAHHALAAS